MSELEIINITGYGSGGEGTGRLADGRVVFVRGAARGDVCRIAITEESARSCRGSLAEIIEPSPHRIEPDCPHYPQCGGCDFRHITYEEELRAKLERVNDALSRIAKVDLRAEEILTTGQVNGYRNKAVFHVGEDAIGFYRAGSHEVCPIDHCLLLPDELNEMLLICRGEHRSPASGDTPPERRGGPACPPAGGHIGPPLQGNTLTYRASDTIQLDGLAFQVSPASFFQINTAAALLLFNKAREFASLSKSDTLIDLYCGVGALTLFLGRDAGQALGVESNHAAIKDAKENARRNGLEHVRFICADAANWDINVGATSGRPRAGTQSRPVITVDPPRKGLSKQAVRKLLELEPARIVYISCDPATMARDIAQLSSYTPKRICAVDMFPRTANVETCLLLERKQKYNMHI